MNVCTTVYLGKPFVPTEKNMCAADGADGEARAQGFALNGTGSLTNF